MVDIKKIQSQVEKALLKSNPSAGFEEKPQSSFSDHLMSGVNAVNKAQLGADQLSSDLASGKSENIHEVMLSLTNAELNFNLMVQVRNKALEAYQEVMRMPV